jgi:CubicO group peptidase (beta-lactamase class C family)
MKKIDFKNTIPGKYLETIISMSLVFAISICLSCDGSSRSDKAYRSRPEKLADGWEVSTPEGQGIDTTRIFELLNLIDDDEYRDIHSLVIVKNGYLVVDEYFNGYDYDDLHPCYSVTKSVSSALIGITLKNGYIDSLGVRIPVYFQDQQEMDWSNGKDKITIKNMLNMRSGLEWEELTSAYSDPRNSHYQMTRSNHWIRFVLQRPMEYAPGSVFEYNTGTSNMFAVIIWEATMISIDSFAQNYLFEPLGITDFYWNRDPRGNPLAGGSRGGVMLFPRDMAKFGFIYLNHGEWNGVQVIPPEWIEKSISPHVNFGGGRGYGYQWWITVFDVDDRSIDALYALGYGGQYIFVIGDLNMIVVFTSGAYGRDYAYTQVFEMMFDFILPAAL